MEARVARSTDTRQQGTGVDAVVTFRHDDELRVWRGRSEGEAWHGGVDRERHGDGEHATVSVAWRHGRVRG